MALVDAGVGDYNLVRVSSIFPPHCEFTEERLAPAGMPIPTAYAHIDTCTPGASIAASIAVAVPQDPSLPGVIMEWHGVGTMEYAEEIVRGMAERAMQRRGTPVREVRSIAVDGVATEEKVTRSVFAAALLF